MNEELCYAEMLEIPVETVTMKRRGRKRAKETETGTDLQGRLVEQVNEHMEDDPLYAESTPIERTAPKKHAKLAGRIVIAEFAAVCVLCAAIFLTNLLMPASAINTFVRGLFQGESEAADTRTYTDFTLSPVVNDYVEADLAVSETGVLSFTAKCSVYAPCEGKVSSVHGDGEGGYTVELKHSDTFTTVMSGLDEVYYTVGDAVKSNLPLGYSGGERAVRVTFYSEGNVLNCYTLGENGLAWS